jgi:tRNA-specific 2-thiouridylase
VRKIAEEQGLATAEKKDSQGICFVGKVDLPTFLQQKLSPRKGRIIEIPESYFQVNGSSIFEPTDPEVVCKPHAMNPSAGEQVGLHNGAHFFTIGQNKGLNVGGRPKPSFVIGVDTDKNLIYTGLGKDHPGLYRKGLIIDASEEHWVREDLKLEAGDRAEFLVRIRYRQPLQKAMLIKTDEKLYVVFDKKQRGITSGQFAAWYKEDELVGSAPIFS